ncbi:MAG: SUMF1/EgtB/PvdO family nonheme iron enzyme [Rhodospirillales bacterium]
MNGRVALVAGIGATLFAVAAAALSLRGPDPAYLPAFAARPWAGTSGDIYVAKYEVTVAEWNRCNDAGACSLRLKTRGGLDPATTPATGLNWLDTREYVAWINRRARHPLRLPTRREWNDMAASVLPPKPDPIFTDPALRWAADYLTDRDYPRALRPSGTFSESREGVFDLDGSVWEWTSECYHENTLTEHCAAFWAGGLHLSVLSIFTRDPARGGCAVGAPPAHLGMRLVSDRAPPDWAQR